MKEMTTRKGDRSERVWKEGGTGGDLIEFVDDVVGQVVSDGFDSTNDDVLRWILIMQS